MITRLWGNLSFRWLVAYFCARFASAPNPLFQIQKRRRCAKINKGSGRWPKPRLFWGKFLILKQELGILCVQNTKCIALPVQKIWRAPEFNNRLTTWSKLYTHFRTIYRPTCVIRLRISRSKYIVVRKFKEVHAIVMPSSSRQGLKNSNVTQGSSSFVYCHDSRRSRIYRISEPNSGGKTRMSWQSLGVKKILLFPETWTKKIGSVGRVFFFFYNGASKYTKLLHTFLSLLSSSYIVLWHVLL